jgi:hypothetical protein
MSGIASPCLLGTDSQLLPCEIRVFREEAFQLGRAGEETESGGYSGSVELCTSV